MNQTVENMDVVIGEIKKSLGSASMKEVKTLANIYQNMLSGIPNTTDDKALIDKLESHESDFNKLILIMESKSIPKMLKNGEYVSVNNMTDSVIKMRNILDSLDRLIHRLYLKFRNRILYVVKNKSELNDKSRDINSKFKVKSRYGSSYKFEHESRDAIHTAVTYDYVLDVIRGYGADELVLSESLTSEEVLYIKSLNLVK